MATVIIPEDPEDIPTWIKEVESKQNGRDKEVSDLVGELKLLTDEEQKIVVEYNRILKAKKVKQEAKDAIAAKTREEQLAIEAAKKKLNIFLSDEAMRKAYLLVAASFDKHTAGAYWREFAYDYQLTGAKQLAVAKRGILADTRGLGKTLSAIIYNDMLSTKRVIVFAPKDVLSNFKKEIEYWAKTRNVAIIAGLNKGQRDMVLDMLAMDQSGEWILLCNYEAWNRDAAFVEKLKNLRADSIIVDEAHNIKNPKTSAYKGINAVIYSTNMCDNCGGIPHRIVRHGFRQLECPSCLATPKDFMSFCSVKNVLLMTGTAILNRPQELWTLLHLVNKELYPTENDFLKTYCEFSQYTQRWGFKTDRFGNSLGAENLLKALGPKFVRRTKKTLSKLGIKTAEQVVIKHELQFDKSQYPQQFEVMEQIREHDAILMAENVKLDVVGVLPQLLRRRQAVTWPFGIKLWEYDDDGHKTGRVLYDCPVRESQKMDEALRISKEIVLEEEDRLVIFSQFKEALKELEIRFARLGISVARYDGDISDDEAEVVKSDFDLKYSADHSSEEHCTVSCPRYGKDCKGYKYQVVVAHYKKGGVGLNLNAARQMIILDREWNPGKEDQAMGRIDRIDNTKDTIVHILHIEGTIDAFMNDLMEEKRAMINGFENKYEEMEGRLQEVLRSTDYL